MVALGGGAVSYERGTPVVRTDRVLMCAVRQGDAECRSQVPTPEALLTPLFFFMTLKPRVECYKSL